MGFKNPQEALKAKDWFDKTFIDSTRISVGVVEVRVVFWVRCFCGKDDGLLDL